MKPGIKIFINLEDNCIMLELELVYFFSYFQSLFDRSLMTINTNRYTIHVRNVTIF